jgi:hypothetical protein
MVRPPAAATTAAKSAAWAATCAADARPETSKSPASTRLVPVCGSQV